MSSSQQVLLVGGVLATVAVALGGSRLRGAEVKVADPTSVVMIVKFCWHEYGRC